MAFGRKKQDDWDGRERRQPTLVLVVNDDHDGAELLVRLLGHAGYRATPAYDDVDAMGQVHDLLPRCVVLDMTRGGVGSSLKVLDSIRSHADPRIHRMRVLLCAASAKNRSFSYQSGADAFLVRPFHIDDLLALVAEVMERPDKERAEHRRAEQR